MIEVTTTEQRRRTKSANKPCPRCFTDILGGTGGLCQTCKEIDRTGIYPDHVGSVTQLVKLPQIGASLAPLAQSDGATASDCATGTAVAKTPMRRAEGRAPKAQHGITAIIDTREQIPLDLEGQGLAVIREALPFGDYSLAYPNMRRHSVIELKKLPDFIGCCGKERQRFMKECLALRGYKYRFIIGMFDLGEVLDHEYRGMMEPNAVFATIARLQVDGIQFVPVGNEVTAAKMVGYILKSIARDVIDFARVACQEGGE
jgi:hypothetical protein